MTASPCPGCWTCRARAAAAPMTGRWSIWGRCPKRTDAGGLRVGWVIAAPEMIAALAAANRAATCAPAACRQMVALRALQRDILAASCRRFWPPIARRDALCAAMDAHLGNGWTGRCRRAACSLGAGARSAP